MGKTAFIFPGQGAQYIGMGKDFHEQIPVSKEVFELASNVSGLDVAALCFEENDKINITEYTQIAMLAMEVAILKAIEERGYKPDVTAGLSLGEYGAITAAGVMSAEDVFKVVRKRGIYMQEAVPEGGAMVAVLGLDTAVIEEVCAKTEGVISIANYNCPGQIVITGESDAAERAVQVRARWTRAFSALKEAGAKRCVPLNVSGPFHSCMLEDAGEKLDRVLNQATVCDIRIPYLSNVTADYVMDKEQVKPLLVRQVSSPVRWQQSVERMIADGVDIFVEIGPGKTLSGFMRKINKEVKTLNIEKVEDLEKLSVLKGE